MKKLILIISIFVSGIYLANFISAITVTKNSGEVLDNITWTNISNLTNKIDVSSSDIKLNGKLYVTGKLCDNSGKCLGDGPKGTENNPGLSCNDILISGNSTGSGNYYIKPTGYIGNAFQTYCDMDNADGGWTHVMTFGSNSILTDNAVGGINDASFKYNTDTINKLLGGTSGEIMIDFGNGKRNFLKLARGPLKLNTQTTYFKTNYNNNYNNYCTHNTQESGSGGGVRNYFFIKAKCDSFGVNCVCQASNYEGMVYKPSGFYDGGANFWGGLGYSENYKMYVKSIPRGESNVGLSCKDILYSGESTGNGIYYIDPNGGDDSDKFQVYCDMTTDGGGWTLLGKTIADYPPANWLTTNIGTTPSSLSTNALYSINGSKINFTELIAGINGDTTKHYGFNIPGDFERNRFFEETKTGSETCTKHEMYYTTDSGSTKKGFYSGIYKETLISDRRSPTKGGLDFASLNCSGSNNELAVFRENDNHSCSAGICLGGIYSYSSFSGFYQDGPTQSYVTAKGTTPLYSGSSKSPVWIMVR
ncbi:MAG: fibrinogen-like YCDxxxxGGGW domain-containing protein [Candidatus Gracilibacteria bacterium]|nr:fibrinogen-like YCDxxxxGGGW domain-containing protein [Candidatus Gracilibacteria bacterium]